ncbi:hypothetical protein P3T76_002776 [Phytophthora citrophthora]|uniref:Bacteriophage T5 Orf172 DNA-binding domain-containing protein n=1 Tax=Phytophthora citrophthora TaxID=4793 RepID=A0AAD9LQ89_9STRA|nr:hypothetical protein P3T76_002776 [Phytophthora citrophthora]
METWTLTQKRQEKFHEWTTRRMPRDANGRVISHRQLRRYEKGFPTRVYFKGTPFVPWKDLQPWVGRPCGWNRFQGHFQDHILVGDNNEWTYKSNTEIFGKGESTYLKLEDVLQERSMLLAARSRRDDWEDGIFDEDVKNPNRPYVVHRKPLVNGVFYEPPDSHEVGGVYAVHCGLVSSFNPNTSGETNFVVKVGSSDDILRRLREHQQTRSLRKHGEVVFLFGVEIDKNYQVAAENLLKDMLTELGFPHVKEGGAETYAFNETTLPLIHDVFCGIRYVYDPPIGRQVCGHKNSAENPLLEQGLPHELQTLVQKVKKLLSSIPGWTTSSEGGGRGVRKGVDSLSLISCQVSRIIRWTAFFAAQTPSCCSGAARAG